MATLCESYERCGLTEFVWELSQLPDAGPRAAALALLPHRGGARRNFDANRVNAKVRLLTTFVKAAAATTVESERQPLLVLADYFFAEGVAEEIMSAGGTTAPRALNAEQQQPTVEALRLLPRDESAWSSGKSLRRAVAAVCEFARRSRIRAMSWKPQELAIFVWALGRMARRVPLVGDLDFPFLLQRTCRELLTASRASLIAAAGRTGGAVQWSAQAEATLLYGCVAVAAFPSRFLRTFLRTQSNSSNQSIKFKFKKKNHRNKMVSENTYVSPIATPLVAGKLEAKTLKLLKKAFTAKAVKRGIPEITKLVRKEKKGIAIFAGDVFPVDLIAHLPTLCEEKEVMYAFLPTRQLLGEAISSKRGVSAVFVPTPTSDSPYESAYATLFTALKVVHPYLGEGKAMEEEAGVEVGGGAEGGAAGGGELKKEKKSKKRGDAADAGADGAAGETGIDAAEDEPAKKKKKKAKTE
eukprot:g19082.t1